MADNDQTTKDPVATEENLDNSDNAEVSQEQIDADNLVNDTEPATDEEVSAEDIEADESGSSADFRVGDTVVVNYRISEGDKSRIQPFTGIVIGIKSSGMSKTFTVRRMAVANIGVERIFPLNSPNIESVVVKSRGKVRRAKLYYLRDRVGKSATKVKRRD